MRFPSIALCAFVLSSAARADVATSLPSSPVAAAAVTSPRSAVLTDVDADGTVWAKGKGYKLRVAPDGAAFQPILGARAPRTLSLDLTLDALLFGAREVSFQSSVTPALDGDRVLVDRGAVIEQFDLGLDQVRHSFWLPRRLGPGDLMLRLKTGNDLTWSGRAGGLRFRADELGFVTYGDIEVIDAGGRRWSLESRYADGAIELVVPSNVLGSARYPLFVDPSLSFVSVDNDADDDEDPDVAFTGGRYLVVYEEVVSATDRDIISRRFDLNGNLLDEVGVDLSNQDTIDPAVAASGSDFLVVWNELGSGLLSDNTIRARRRSFSNTVQGTAFDVSNGSNNEQHPDVGGNPALVNLDFLVVWDEDPVIGTRHVKGRLVNGLGTLGAEIVIAATDKDEFNPVVSKSAGPTQRFAVIWEQIEPTSARLLGCRGVRGNNGTILQTVLGLATRADGQPFHADIDGQGKDFVAVYELPDSNNPTRVDIAGRRIVVDSGDDLNSSNPFNVSKLAISANEQVDQFLPAVALEGCRFTVCYLRHPATSLSQTEVFATNLALPPALNAAPVMVEKEFLVASSLTSHRDLKLCSTEFDEPGRQFAVWTRTVSQASDNIEGRFLDSLVPGGITVVQTGCGSPEPALVTTNVPAVGAPFGLLMLGFSTPLPLVAIGPVQNIPLCPGQGGCVLGVNPQILFNSSPVVQGVIPCDPILLGFQIGIQGIDVLPANAAGPACGPPIFSQKFRTSDTLVLSFQ